jgi:2-haloacid dehalogenase
MTNKPLPEKTALEYRWLLFDADNTLFDYRKAEAFALETTFADLGILFREDYLDTYRRYNRQVWDEFERGEVTSVELRAKRFRLFFGKIDAESDPEIFSARYLKNLSHGSQLVDGAAEILQALSKHYHLAVVTNGLKDVQRPRLEASTIRGLVEQLIISEEVGAAKPSKEYFEAAFERIGRPDKAEVLIVGDSLTSDMQGGLDYGIDTCWYNPQGAATELPITYRIRNLHELLDLLL